MPYVLNKKSVLAFYENWRENYGEGENNCKICAHVYTSAVWEDVSSFTIEMKARLFAVHELVYQCERCGQFYFFARWTETPDWGESMRGITEKYQREGLYKRSWQESLNWCFEILEKNIQIELMDGGKDADKLLKLFKNDLIFIPKKNPGNGSADL